MDDLISRAETIKAINTWDKFGVDDRCRVVRWHEGLEPYVHLRDVVTAIVNMPSAEQVGHWIGKPIAGYCRVRCSVCGDVFLENDGRWNYCPNCGARMKGEEDVSESY